MQLEWAIVGGGIHGVHFAAHLIAQGIATHDKIRIFDPAPKLLERWRERTSATGMSFLRSSSVHHLDIEPWSLDRFAGARKGKRKKKAGLFAPPYARPALELFNSHCTHVIETYGLEALHIQERVTDCSIHCDGVHLQTTSQESVVAENILLAIGGCEEPHRPQWAEVNDSRITHIFERDGDAILSDTRERVAVIGGGISAGQVALRLANEGHGVSLISRHSLRQHQFDSDPGWLGPKYMKRFSREESPDKRRSMITEARHRGSVPPDVKRALRRAIEQQELHWHEDEVKSLELTQDDITLSLCGGEDVKVDRVLLATGFETRRPGGSMVNQLVKSAALPCATCGFPVLDSALRWHPRIYVSGPLAELQIGPVARNIAGAQRASDRIMAALKRAQTPRRQTVSRVQKSQEVRV